MHYILVMTNTTPVETGKAEEISLDCKNAAWQLGLAHRHLISFIINILYQFRVEHLCYFKNRRVIRGISTTVFF